MARAKVVHSEDAATIIFNGDKTSPEPSTGIIKFPGGHVEVSRTSDGKYWAHIWRDKTGDIESRIDYDYEGNLLNGIIDVPNVKNVQHIALKI